MGGSGLQFRAFLALCAGCDWGVVVGGGAAGLLEGVAEGVLE